MNILSKIKKAVADSILYWSENGLGVEVVNDSTALERYSICQICKRFDAKNDTCNECGCIMSVKTKLKTDPFESVANFKKIETKCPIGQW